MYETIGDREPHLPLMQALEEVFPDSTLLLPKEPQAAAAVKEFCEW
jgi:hypothetical protein